MPSNRILVVEDEKAISDFIALNLGYTGYTYTVLADGADAWAHLEMDHAYDLALLDVMLPGMDGFHLLEKAREYDIPVIFLTAKTDIGSKVKGLRDGGEDYIVKPFEVLELLVRVEKVLERTGKIDKILRYKDIEINIEDHRITRGSEEIALKPLEFELFTMLVRYKNRVLPRERLLNEIWGIDFVGGTRTVDVHVAQLRKKLGLADELKSVPKIGYRLEE